MFLVHHCLDTAVHDLSFPFEIPSQFCANYNNQIELRLNRHRLVVVDSNRRKSEICVWFQNRHSMSVIDILTRVDSICKKYDKYDVEKHRDSNVSGDDAFARLYASVDADIEALIQVRPRRNSHDSICALIGEFFFRITELGVSLTVLEEIYVYFFKLLCRKQKRLPRRKVRHLL